MTFSLTIDDAKDRRRRL